MRQRGQVGWWASWLAAGAVVLVLLGGWAGCTKVPDPWEKLGPGKRVVVSFPPLYSFTKNVAGDDAPVLCLLTTHGPHDYPYDPKDLLPLRSADLFLVNGLGLDEDFSEKLKTNCGNSKLKMVELAEEGIKEVDPSRLRKPEEGEQPGHDDGHHHHGEYDPHVWLGLPEAVLMVKQIAKELAEIDPPHAAGYEKRAADYIKKLEQLQADGKKALAGPKEERRLVTTHDALGYFARCFDLEIVGYIQPRAGAGIDSRDLAKLADLCKEKKVRVLCTEPQFPPADVETLITNLRTRLQGQSEPKLVEVDPLETTSPGDTLDAGWYERKMRENIDRLARAFHP
jgi:zinc transport system substrate-binding protein